ncbi:MAG: DUF1043 family protein [Pseudomonadota bacterium]
MTVEFELLILAAVVISALSIGIGYWWASSRLKRAAGGKSVQELTAEKEQYQERVEDHFKTTAELLNEMTDKYRDVYRHMAEGARDLAPSDSAEPALAALRAGLLSAPNSTAQESSEPIESATAAVEPDEENADAESTQPASASAEPEAVDDESNESAGPATSAERDDEKDGGEFFASESDTAVDAETPTDGAAQEEDKRA